eukprot:scaffold3079_cov119-Cylindrotheca_fusiformis.AAC.10
MANNLATNAASIRSGGGVQTETTKVEGDIREAKGRGVRGGRARIFTRAEEEEETQAQHVGDALGVGCGGIGKRGGHDMKEKGDRNRFYPVRCRVPFRIVCEESAETKVDGTLEGEPGIRGPQQGGRLANAA